MQRTTEKPSKRANLYEPLGSIMEEDENPDKVLNELREKFNPKRPQDTDQLRETLLEMCKGKSIGPETCKELHSLGFSKEELGM